MFSEITFSIFLFLRMYLRDKQKQVIKLENWYFIIASVKCSDIYKYYKNIKKKKHKKTL